MSGNTEDKNKQRTQRTETEPGTKKTEKERRTERYDRPERSAESRNRRRNRRGKRKKVTKAGVIGTVFTILLLVLAVFLGLTSRWAYKTWPKLNIEETIYHLTAPIEGTGGGIIEGFLLTCLLPSLVLLAVCVFYAVRNQGKKAFFRLKQAVALVSAAAIAVECGIAWNRLGVGTFIRNQTTDDPFIEENYADPAKTAMEFPEKKRNLVYIFLESMENTFTDFEHGGGFENNYIPETAALSSTRPAIP